MLSKHQNDTTPLPVFSIKTIEKPITREEIDNLLSASNNLLEDNQRQEKLQLLATEVSKLRQDNILLSRDLERTRNNNGRLCDRVALLQNEKSLLEDEIKELQERLREVKKENIRLRLETTKKKLRDKLNKK